MIDETAETIVTEPETEAIETTIEESLYDAESKNDEPIDETKEETSDSETEEVAESKEETESVDDGEASNDHEKKVDYNLELSEASLMDNSMLKEIESFAKEHNMSSDVATGLLGKQEELLAKWVESKSVAIEAEKDGWRNQVVNDKSLGGENLNTTIEHSRRVVEKFASPEFVSMLRETGYGDHPEVVRFFAKLGSTMSNDTLINGKEFGGEKTTEDYFYGTN